MHKGICHLSLIPIRAEARSQSELVSQLLFGEIYTVCSNDENWIQIKTDSDSYMGWISSNQFCALEKIPEKTNVLNVFPFVEAIEQDSKTKVYLLPGSMLHDLRIAEAETVFYIGTSAFKAKINEVNIEYPEQNQLLQFALKFLKSPYLWGGRSMWGMDCSGFTQLMYRIAGVDLPRDAWQQAERGEVVDFVEESKFGDLAFFDNEQGKITHVGMILKPGEIIHASGEVKIEKIDSYGIYNEKLGGYSHKLRVVKRVRST